MSATQPEAMPGDCPLCHGTGEVSISVDGTHDGTDYYGCPICISRERDEDIKRLRALNADLLVALKETTMVLDRIFDVVGDAVEPDSICGRARAAIAKSESGKRCGMSIETTLPNAAVQRAHPVDMRNVLTTVDSMKMDGILFVPIPVLSGEDHHALLKELNRRLRALEQIAEGGAA